MSKQKRDKKAAANQFAIYEVRFKKAQQTSAFFQDVDMDRALANAPSLFLNLFSKEKLVLGKTIRNSDNESKRVEYRNDIIAVNNNVFLLRIHNNKKYNMVLPDKKLENGHMKYEEAIRWSYPYCYAVVDAREYPVMLAIQKNSAFGDPDNVRKILMSGLNEMWRVEQPLEVEIYAKTRESEIWEFCNSRCQDHEDAIKRISFDFPNLKDYYIDQNAPKLPPFLEDTSKMMELTNALKMHMHMDYQNADPEKLERQTENVAQVVRYCGRNTSFKLIVKFREYGDYRCDEKVRALFPMGKDILSDFIACFEDIPFEDDFFALITWCNKIKQKAQDYQNALQIPAKRHRKCQK